MSSEGDCAAAHRMMVSISKCVRRSPHKCGFAGPSVCRKHQCLHTGASSTPNISGRANNPSPSLVIAASSEDFFPASQEEREGKGKQISLPREVTFYIPYWNFSEGGPGLHCLVVISMKAEDRAGEDGLTNLQFF